MDLEALLDGYSKSSFRKVVFKLCQFYGQPVIEPFLSDWLHPFFIELFPCQKRPGRCHIALDNLSEEEKMIIQNHLPMLLINFMKCNFSCLKNYEREFLTGLVLFRVEVLPIFRTIFEPDQTYDLNPIIRRLNYWEKHFKNVVLAAYAKGLLPTIKNRYVRSVTEQVRATYKWWNDDYNEVDDTIELLAQEYALED